MKKFVHKHVLHLKVSVVSVLSVVSAAVAGGPRRLVSAAGAGGPHRNWRALHVGRRPSAAPRGHRTDETQIRDETRREVIMPQLVWLSAIDTTYSTDPHHCFLSLCLLFVAL